MNELAAADLHELLMYIVDHINHLTKKQLSTLVIDFIKNSDNQYVLSEIIAFQFDQSESSVQPKYNVARRPILMKFQIESYFKCDLDTVPTDIDVKEESTADDEQEHELDGLNMCAYITAALKAKALTVTDDKDLQTPNTVLCRMCLSRVNSTSARYHVTSTMIYSTVMHLRARLPAHQWPSFCSDNSYTLLSMQRNIQSVIGDGPSLSTTTEANLFLCSSCYRLYQEETNLIQLEHQIGVLMKNQGLKSDSHEESTFSNPSTTHSPSRIPTSSPKKSITSPKKSILTSPLNPRSSSVTSTSRPSSAPAGKRLSPAKKISLFSSSSSSSRPSIDALPRATANMRFQARNSSSVGLDYKKKEPTVIVELKQEQKKQRGTIFQLAKPRELTETYTETFLNKKKTPVELLSDSDIRDKFRDKNNPSNHNLPFFVDPENKKDKRNKPSSQTSLQVEERHTYQKASDPPVGNVVSRTDVPLYLTVCRLAVNLHEVRSQWGVVI
jgi:hypothetical protein